MEQVLQAVRNRCFARLGPTSVREGEPLLCVGWSGGVDSTVLLDLADRLRARLGFELAAVHVRHGLREGGRGDAAFCRRFAADRGIPLVVEAIDVREGPSVEAQARHQRYAAIARAGRGLGATHVATAHHADDAVETALLNWTRGTGTRGLSTLLGLSTADETVPGAQDLELLRPLVETSRAAIEAYARRRGLEWREDPMNAERSVARNRLRRDVVPALRREADSVEPLVRTLENVRSDAAAIEESARSRVHAPGPGESRTSRRFSTSELAQSPEAVGTAALRIAARDLPGPVGWRHEQLDRAMRMVDAAHEEGSSGRLSIRGGRLVVEEDSTLLHSTHLRGGSELDDRRAHPIGISVSAAESGGAWRGVPWFHGRLEWRVVPAGGTPSSKAGVARFDAERLPDELLLRGPRAGERFEAFGMEGTKSILDVLRDGGVGHRARWRWPVLARPDCDAPAGALWIAGLRRSAHAPLEASTEEVLCVRWIEKGGSGGVRECGSGGVGEWGSVGVGECGSRG